MAFCCHKINFLMLISTKGIWGIALKQDIPAAAPLAKNDRL
jgi:hypothetical protein